MIKQILCYLFGHSWSDLTADYKRSCFRCRCRQQMSKLRIWPSKPFWEEEVDEKTAQKAIQQFVLPTTVPDENVTLYLVDFKIGSRSYGVNMPAISWEHAQSMADGFGGKVIGSDIHEVTAIPIPQLMDFISVCTEELKWKYNAEEQLESFLSVGWPDKPDRT